MPGRSMTDYAERCSAKDEVDGMTDGKEWTDTRIGNPLTKEDWKNLLNNKDVFTRTGLEIVKCWYEFPEGASCKQISNHFGGAAQRYNSYSINQNRKIADHLGFKHGNETDSKLWPIMFLGRWAVKGEAGKYIYKLRPELLEAISEMDGLLDGIEVGQITKTIDRHSGIEEQYGLNTILYGPPGTGKTYNVKKMAVEIIDDREYDDREEINRRYDELSKEGRIDFVTFHQSYGYEEFIEGIKPCFDDDDSNLTYTIEDGTFKRFCLRAMNSNSNRNKMMNNNPLVWKVSLFRTGDNPIRRECLENGHIRFGYGEDGDDDQNNGKDILINRMSIGDIVLSCHTMREIDAIGIVTGDYRIDEGYDTFRSVRDVRWVRIFDNPLDIVEHNNGKTMSHAAIHQMKFIDTQWIYELINEDMESHPYSERSVFIIDEINRGNISRIFGELITLLEPSKRLGASDSMSVRLPYSKNEFSVPGNIYVIGTMNTADRSLVNLDTALRRRFGFIEMMPDESLLNDNVEGVDLQQLLSTINRRIEVLYDREHTLGHVFLMGVDSMEGLESAFRKNIIPMLQEYFHNDYSKILRVLSRRSDSTVSPFIRLRETDDIFTDGCIQESYEILWEAMFDADEYISIYKQD